jgi:uroporphyrinogen-III synthase
MRLLITRPEPDNERTAAALRAVGHVVVLAPLLRVEPVKNAPLGDGPWTAVLFTSANGARAIAEHDRRGELLRLPVLAVGQASAAAARDAGFFDVASADGDGGDLARLAAARFAGSGRPLLYLAGEERARDMDAELTRAGLKVATVIVYRTVKAGALPEKARAALASGAIDGVLHFSRRSAEAYVDCTRELEDGALAPTHYCLSARVAEPLRLAGAREIRVVAKPNEAGMLALVTPRP